jgi:hypothetical protein
MLEDVGHAGAVLRDGWEPDAKHVVRIDPRHVQVPRTRLDMRQLHRYNGEGRGEKVMHKDKKRRGGQTSHGKLGNLFDTVHPKS